MLVKKLLIFVLLLTTAIPTQTVFAASPTREEVINEVITNLSNASSAEYSLTLVSKDTMPEDGENAIYGSVYGSYEVQSDGSVTTVQSVAYRQIVNDEQTEQHNLEFFTDNQDIYALVNNGDNTRWNVLYGETEYPYLEDVTEKDDRVSTITEILNSDAIVVTGFMPVYQNIQWYTRTKFTIDNDALIDLLNAYDEYDDISDEDLSEMRTYLNQYVTSTGSITVNNKTMLPSEVKINVVVEDNDNDIHQNTDVTFTFRSFNRDLTYQTPDDTRTVVSVFSLFSLDDDDDGLTNSQETYYQTNPKNADTDGDGYTDGEEVRNYYDPNGPWQMDYDKDGLGDRDERYIWFTIPYTSDTDSDGYDDRTEVVNGYNPNGSGRLDSDNDGLSDYDEIYTFHTDRFNADTDGDGYKDGQEVYNGYNPNGLGR